MGKWVYVPRFAVRQVLESSETIAQLKSIASSARAARKQAAVVAVDVFGNPVDQVSPRVQRIRDLQAKKGKRVFIQAQPVKVVNSEPVDTRSFSEQAKDMFSELDSAIERGET
ncbi:MAG: hypothetical protein J7K90_09710 [Desulfuromusa sp.]|nr:hypothetical protein [Desulfuromusa sp.]